MGATAKMANSDKKKESLKSSGENNPGLTRLETDAPESMATVTELPKIIAESKAALESEPPQPLKRKRGRPPRVAAVETPSEKPATAISQAPETHEVSLAPMISDGLQMFYEQRAAETGYQGFKIKADKADILAMQAEQVASIYFPQLSEKASVAVVCALSWGMHVLGTEMGYRRWKLQQQMKENPKVEEVEKKIQVEKTQPAVNAAQFFPHMGT